MGRERKLENVWNCAVREYCGVGDGVGDGGEVAVYLFRFTPVLLFSLYIHFLFFSVYLFLYLFIFRSSIYLFINIVSIC